MSDEETVLEKCPTLCRLGFHKWSKWEKYGKNYGGLINETKQRKTCMKCGLIEQESVDY